MNRIRLRVSALCVQEESVLFIEHKSFALEDPLLPDTWWILPGGVVEPGETMHEALVREMKEETGLDCRIGPMVFVKELLYPDPGKPGAGECHHSVSVGFHCKVTEGSLITGRDPELSESDQMIIQARWLPIGSLDEYELYPPFLKDLVIRHHANGFADAVPRFYDSPL